MEVLCGLQLSSYASLWSSDGGGECCAGRCYSSIYMILFAMYAAVPWTTDTITTLVCELHSPRPRAATRRDGPVLGVRCPCAFRSGCTYLRGEELSQERKAQVHLQ